MFFTKIGLTQYEIHDNFNPLEEYNRDMRTITTTATVAAGRVDVVEQESKDRDKALQNDIDTNHNGIVANANDISELKAKDIELEDRIDLNKQDIATLQVTTSSISAQLLSHIETSTSFSAAILEEVKDNYTELKTDIAADRERLAVAETAIANIENGDTEIAGRVTELERDNRDNKDAIEALQLVDQSQGESIQDLHNRMTTAESNITANENDITALDGRMTTAEQNIEDLQAKVTKVIPTFEDVNIRDTITFTVNNNNYVFNAEGNEIITIVTPEEKEYKYRITGVALTGGNKITIPAGTHELTFSATDTTNYKRQPYLLSTDLTLPDGLIIDFYTPHGITFSSATRSRDLTGMLYFIMIGERK